MLSRIDAHRFFYRFIKHQISLSELEQWIYCHDELERILDKTEYLDFISRDYTTIIVAGLRFYDTLHFTS
ncbi:hypothetical protein [Paenibacillus phytorum]|uniref:hypothetical protein n=1 Tax=Paenibacillus phytorum TaxID=2654977 RepID=UPI001FE3530C|nr:hypothetical protein [Paenibacillus phytorum]